MERVPGAAVDHGSMSERLFEFEDESERPQQTTEHNPFQRPSMLYVSNATTKCRAERQTRNHDQDQGFKIHWKPQDRWDGGQCRMDQTAIELNKRWWMKWVPPKLLSLTSVNGQDRLKDISMDPLDWFDPVSSNCLRFWIIDRRRR